MACVLCGRLCPDWKADYVKVDELLSQAVRASRAVEGVNSVVRMHQGRHRHVSQEMLDLKRLYWNCPDSPGFSGKITGIDMVEVIGSLSRQRNSSHGCVATGNQGTSCSQHLSPLVYHVIRGNVKELLVTADAGGSNGYRLRLWKVALQELADAIGLRIFGVPFSPRDKQMEQD